MKLDELYKFIGYGVVSFFILYIVVKSIRFQIGIVEGLTNNLRGKKPAAATEQRPTQAQQGQAEQEQAQAEQEAEQDSDSEQEQED